MYDKEIADEFDLADELYFMLSEDGRKLNSTQLHELILRVDGVNLAIAVYHTLVRRVEW